MHSGPSGNSISCYGKQVSCEEYRIMLIEVSPWMELGRFFIEGSALLKRERTVPAYIYGDVPKLPIKEKVVCQSMKTWTTLQGARNSNSSTAVIFPTFLRSMRMWIKVAIMTRSVCSETSESGATICKPCSWNLWSKDLFWRAMLFKVDTTSLSRKVSTDSKFLFRSVSGALQWRGCRIVSRRLHIVAANRQLSSVSVLFPLGSQSRSRAVGRVLVALGWLESVVAFSCLICCHAHYRKLGAYRWGQTATKRFDALIEDIGIARWSNISLSFTLWPSRKDVGAVLYRYCDFIPWDSKGWLPMLPSDLLGGESANTRGEIYIGLETVSTVDNRMSVATTRLGWLSNQRITKPCEIVSRGCLAKKATLSRLRYAFEWR